jgi:hypothetical protein
VSALMVKCPHTGGSIFTGIETDAESFEAAPDVPMRTHCPLCHREHTWWKREAWLQDLSPDAQVV